MTRPALLCLLLAGCAAPTAQPPPAPAPSIRTAQSAAAAVRGIVKPPGWVPNVIPPPPVVNNTVTLSWTPFDPGDHLYQVHLVLGVSSDLASWGVLAALPCSATNYTYTTTNAAQFWRIGWDWGYMEIPPP